MKILITGASGYVGLRLVQTLSSQHEIVTVGRKLALVHGAEHAQVADYTLGELRRALSGRNFDCVIHLAGPDAEQCNRDFESVLERTRIARALSLFAIENGIASFFYFSSVHVYGKLQGEIETSAELKPVGMYGLSHVMAEKVLFTTLAATKTKLKVLRVSNLIGAPIKLDAQPMRLVANEFCLQAVRDGKIKVQSPDVMRDFLGLRAFTDWMSGILMARVAEAQGVTYLNVSSGNTVTIGELAQKIAKLAREHFKLDVKVESPDINETAERFRVSNSAMLKSGAATSDLDIDLIDTLRRLQTP